jgi:hypothetical protein
MAVVALWFINSKIFDLGVGLDVATKTGWQPEPGYESAPPYFRR